MESEETLLRIGRRLEKRISEQNVEGILDLLKELQRFPVTVALLRSTRVGVIVNKLRKTNKNHQIVEVAKVIVRDWKRVLESSYKKNDVSAPEVKHSPARTEHASMQKEEKKKHSKSGLPSSPHKKPLSEKESFPSSTHKKPHSEKDSGLPSRTHKKSHSEKESGLSSPTHKKPHSEKESGLPSPTHKKSHSEKESGLPSPTHKKSHSEKESSFPSSTHKKPHSEKERRPSSTHKKPHSEKERIPSSTRKKSHSEEESALSDASQTSNLNSSPNDSKPKRESPEISSASPDQQASTKEKKLKRSHSTDVSSSSHTSKKTERRHSLPPSSSSKSSATNKEERLSTSSPTSTVQNGSNKPSSNGKEESNVLPSSPACLSPPSMLLSPCYTTGDSVRDKCVEMVAAALKTDGDYLQFDANCNRLAWEIEDWVYKEMKTTDMKYRNRIRSRISNLKDPKNPNLRRNVLCGSVSTQKIATMSAEEMASDELKELRNTLTQEAIREHQMAKTGGTQTDLLQCDKCKKKNCTYNQVQTRSADEPMTTFVLCNECGNRWKFC